MSQNNKEHNKNREYTTKNTIHNKNREYATKNKEYTTNNTEYKQITQNTQQEQRIHNK
jgi:hypothetical protein